MASIEDVVDGLRGVLDQLTGARRLLAAADLAWEHAAADYSAVTSGASHPETVDLAVLAGHARRLLRETDELTGRCESAVNALIDRIRGGQGLAAGAEPAHRSYPGVATRERERLGRTQEGRRTSGSWIKDDGTVESVESGPDTPWFEMTRAELIRQGRASGDPAARLQRLATHVEVQLVVRCGAELTAAAAAAAERGETGWQPQPVGLSLRLSRQPCGTEPGIPAVAQRFSCDKQLGTIVRRTLPPGSSLTVVDPDGREWTYPRGADR
jgi:hypothetical protein